LCFAFGWGARIAQENALAAIVGVVTVLIGAQST
jgi:hypothetical protein